MGLLLAKAYYFIKNKKERKILILGLDGAGKNTVLYKMKLLENVQVISTNGSNIRSVEYKNLNFIIWDIPDYKRLRQLCHCYCYDSSALIYVLDSTDVQRIKEVNQALEILVEKMVGIPVLILANKQDIAVMSLSEIQEKLQLHKIKGIGEWHIQGCCSLNGEGLYDGFNWLSKTLNEKKYKQNVGGINDSLDSLLKVLDQQQK
ncbi:hypothetical protein ABPG74_010873 [Tetrahymena malaccensis]